MITINFNMWGTTNIMVCSQGGNILEQCYIKHADVEKICNRWRKTYGEKYVEIIGPDSYNSPWRLPLQEQGFAVETRRER